MTSEKKDVHTLPEIEFAHDITEISRRTHIYIHVRGQTLEECRKHFDEILGGVKDA